MNVFFGNGHFPGYIHFLCVYLVANKNYSQIKLANTRMIFEMADPELHCKTRKSENLMKALLYASKIERWMTSVPAVFNNNFGTDSIRTFIAFYLIIYILFAGHYSPIKFTSASLSIHSAASDYIIRAARDLIYVDRAQTIAQDLATPVCSSLMGPSCIFLSFGLHTDAKSNFKVDPKNYRSFVHQPPIKNIDTLNFLKRDNFQKSRSLYDSIVTFIWSLFRNSNEVLQSDKDENNLHYMSREITYMHGNRRSNRKLEKQSQNMLYEPQGIFLEDNIGDIGSSISVTSSILIALDTINSYVSILDSVWQLDTNSTDQSQNINDTKTNNISTINDYVKEIAMNNETNDNGQSASYNAEEGKIVIKMQKRIIAEETIELKDFESFWQSLENVITKHVNETKLGKITKLTSNNYMKKLENLDKMILNDTSLIKNHNDSFKVFHGVSNIIHFMDKFNNHLFSFINCGSYPLPRVYPPSSNVIWHGQWYLFDFPSVVKKYNQDGRFENKDNEYQHPSPINIDSRFYSVETSASNRLTTYLNSNEHIRQYIRNFYLGRGYTEKYIFPKLREENLAAIDIYASPYSKIEDISSKQKLANMQISSYAVLRTPRGWVNLGRPVVVVNIFATVSNVANEMECNTFENSLEQCISTSQLHNYDPFTKFDNYWILRNGEKSKSFGDMGNNGNTCSNSIITEDIWINMRIKGLMNEEVKWEANVLLSRFTRPTYHFNAVNSRNVNSFQRGKNSNMYYASTWIEAMQYAVPNPYFRVNAISFEYMKEMPDGEYVILSLKDMERIKCLFSLGTIVESVAEEVKNINKTTVRYFTDKNGLNFSSYNSGGSNVTNNTGNNYQKNVAEKFSKLQDKRFIDESVISNYENELSTESTNSYKYGVILKILDEDIHDYIRNIHDENDFHYSRKDKVYGDRRKSLTKNKKIVKLSASYDNYVVDLRLPSKRISVYSQRIPVESPLISLNEMKYNNLMLIKKLDTASIGKFADLLFDDIHYVKRALEPLLQEILVNNLDSDPDGMLVVKFPKSKLLKRIENNKLIVINLREALKSLITELFSSDVDIWKFNLTESMKRKAYNNASISEDIDSPVSNDTDDEDNDDEKQNSKSTLSNRTYFSKTFVFGPQHAGEGLRIFLKGNGLSNLMRHIFDDSSYISNQNANYSQQKDIIENISRHLERKKKVKFPDHILHRNKSLNENLTDFNRSRGKQYAQSSDNTDISAGVLLSFGILESDSNLKNIKIHEILNRKDIFLNGTNGRINNKIVNETMLDSYEMQIDGEAFAKTIEILGIDNVQSTTMNSSSFVGNNDLWKNIPVHKFYYLQGKNESTATTKPNGRLTVEYIPNIINDELKEVESSIIESAVQSNIFDAINLDIFRREPDAVVDEDIERTADSGNGRWNYQLKLDKKNKRKEFYVSEHESPDKQQISVKSNLGVSQFSSSLNEVSVEEANNSSSSAADSMTANLFTNNLGPHH